MATLKDNLVTQAIQKVKKYFTNTSTNQVSAFAPIDNGIRNAVSNIKTPTGTLGQNIKQTNFNPFTSNDIVATNVRKYIGDVGKSAFDTAKGVYKLTTPQINPVSPVQNLKDTANTLLSGINTAWKSSPAGIVWDPVMGIVKNARESNQRILKGEKANFNPGTAGINALSNPISPGQTLSNNPSTQKKIDIGVGIAALAFIGYKVADKVITNKLEMQTIKNILNTDSKATLNEINAMFKKKAFDLRVVYNGGGTPEQKIAAQKLNDAYDLFKKNIDIKATTVAPPLELPQGKETTVYRTSNKVEPGNQVFLDKSKAEMFATPNEPVVEFKIPTKDLSSNVIKVKADAGIMDYKGSEVVKPSISTPQNELLNEAKRFKSPQKFVDYKFNEWLSDVSSEFNKNNPLPDGNHYAGSGAYMSKPETRAIANAKYEELKNTLTPIWKNKEGVIKQQTSAVNKVKLVSKKAEDQALLEAGKYIWGNDPTIRVERGTVWKGNASDMTGADGKSIDQMVRTLEGNTNPQAQKILHNLKLNARGYENYQEAYKSQVPVSQISPESGSKLPPHLQKLVDKQNAVKPEFTIEDMTPKGYGPAENTQVVNNIERLKGETFDQAIARKIGYQIDNGTIKINEDPVMGGWKAQINGNLVGTQEPQIIRTDSKSQLMDEVSKILYPNAKSVLLESKGISVNETPSLSTPISTPQTTNIAPPQVSQITRTTPKITLKSPTVKIVSSNGSIPPINPQEYVSQLKQQQIQAGANAPSTIKVKVKSVLGDIKRKLVDSTAPIEDTLFSTIKKNKLTISPSQNISNQIDRSIRSRELAGQFAKDNGFVDVIKGVPNVDTLDQYLIAKHATEVKTTTGRDTVKDQQLVNQLQGEYEPYAQQVVKYGQKLLDYSVNSGLVDANVATQLKKQYPNYVPLNRIFSELEKSTTLQGTGKGVASLSKQTVVLKLKGSERAIASPIESLLSKTADAFSQGERNIAGKQLASYRNLPGNPFEIRELKPGESYPHTFSFLDNGVKRTFATTPEIAAAAKFLDKRQLGFVGNLFAAPVRLARIGITGINLPFIGSNLVKDQVSAFVNSNKGLQTSLLNVPVFLKSLWTAVGHGAEYDNWIRNAGGGTSFDISRSQPKLTVKQVRSTRNIPSRILYTATHPGELLRSVENIINRGEEMTRLQQFIGTRDALVKEGKSLEDANILAAKASREATVNFGRSGDWGKALNSVFLYMNAGIQGSRTLLRNLKAKPIKTTAKIVVSVLVPLTIITAWNLSDDKRKEAYDDIQEWEKDGNLVLVPDNPTKDPKTGKWNVIKIPLSQEFANMTVPFRKTIEATYGGDSATAMDITKAVIGSSTSLNVQNPQQLFGQFTPQAVKPGLEMALNKNMFTGSDIVPEYIDGKPSSSLLPEQQVREDTSGTARAIGGVFNTSPIKVEQFVKSTMGGVGSQLINFSDQQLANLGLIPQEQVGGQSIKEGFSSRFSLATGGQKLSNLYDSIDKANQTGSSLDLNQAVVNNDKVYYPTLVKHKDGTTSYTLKSEPNVNYSKPYVGSGKRTFESSPEAPKNVIERINLAVKAVTTNPTNIKSVVSAIFTQERMRKMTGDTLIFERETNLNKTSDTTDAVDHIIPLSLGGDNSDANKRYLSAEANQEKAKLETKLYRQLLNNEITGSEARKQISDYVDKYETPNATATANKQTEGTQYEITDKTNGNKTKIDLSPIPEPTYTGQKELDKKIKSKYTSAITKQVNDIVKLYEDGQLTAQQAESMISKLKTKSTKSSGTKANKIKLNVSASKKIPIKVINYKLKAGKTSVKVKVKKIAIRPVNK